MTQTKKDRGSFRRASTLSLSLSTGALALLAGSGQAEAKLLEVYADAYAGGMYGTEPDSQMGSVVTQKPDNSRGDDFYHDNSGGLLGLRAGIEVLYTDFYVQFDQMLTSRGFSSSTLQAMLGWDFGIGDGPWRGTLGIFGGLVFGFPYTPHFPIDSSQIATIGLAAEGQGGVERVLNRFFRLQLIGTVGYHYMFAGATPVVIDAAGNTATTQTQGFHLMLKAGIRFNLGI